LFSTKDIIKEVIRTKNSLSDTFYINHVIEIRLCLSYFEHQFARLQKEALKFTFKGKKVENLLFNKNKLEDLLVKGKEDRKFSFLSKRICKLSFHSRISVRDSLHSQNRDHLRTRLRLSFDSEFSSIVSHELLGLLHFLDKHE
jgi:hypothetical protein